MSLRLLAALCLWPAALAGQAGSTRALMCPELLDSVRRAAGWPLLEASSRDSEIRIWNTSCAYFLPESTVRLRQHNGRVTGEVLIWWPRGAMSLEDTAEVSGAQWSTSRAALQRTYGCGRPEFRKGIGLCWRRASSRALWAQAWEVFERERGWELVQTEGHWGLDGGDVVIEAVGLGRRVLVSYWEPGEGRTDEEARVHRIETAIYRLLYPAKP